MIKIEKKKTINISTNKTSYFAYIEQIKSKSELESKCRQEQIGSAILEIDVFNEMIIHYAATNGPSSNIKCSIINCGCSHAESRVLIQYLKRFRSTTRNIKTILISTHYPCKTCANMIIDSKLIDIVISDEFCPINNDSGHNLLDKSLDVRLWTKQMIENDVENNFIKNWLLND